MTAEDNIYDHYAKSTKVIFMAGQSNMAGRDVDGTSLTSRANDGNIYEYRTPDGVSRNSFATNYPNGGPTVDFGPNVGLARSYYSTDRDIVTIRSYFGGHSIAAFLPESEREVVPQTNLPPSDSDRSQEFIDFFNDCAEDMFRRHWQKPTNAVFVWYQGAEDANYTGTQTGSWPDCQDLASMYDEHLPKLVQHAINNTDYLNSSSSVIIVRSPDWQSGPGGPTVKPGQGEVRLAQSSYANETSGVQWITSDINQSVTTTWEDASHIDAASQERLGIDLAALI